MSDPTYLPDSAPAPKPVPDVKDLPKPPLADVPWLTKPSRKVWVFAVSNILIQFLLAFISGHWHFDLAAWLQPFVNELYGVTAPGTPAPGAQAALATGLSFIIAYLTSPSFSDVYKHITAKVIARAVLDGDKKDVSQGQIAAAIVDTKREAAAVASASPGATP